MARRVLTEEEALAKLLDELRRGLIQCVKAIDAYQERQAERKREQALDLPRSA